VPGPRTAPAAPRDPPSRAHARGERTAAVRAPTQAHGVRVPECRNIGVDGPGNIGVDGRGQHRRRCEILQA